MRKFRNISLIFFAISLALFIVYRGREISRRDGSGPNISMESETVEISVKDPEEDLLAGVTASDRRDGDVTDSLVVESLSTFLRPGTRIVTYAAFDRDKHVTKAERQMVYTDYHAPEFSLTSPLVFTPGSMDLMEGLKVTDCLDGDLTDSVKILSDDELLVDVEGTYEVRLQAANSAGDVATLPVLVRVAAANNGAPQILLDNYVTYIDPGEDFDPFSMVSGVAIGGGRYDVVSGSGTYGDEERDQSVKAVVGTDQIKVDNKVDTSKPGTYRVTFSMSIPGNYNETITGETILYVVVRGEASETEETQESGDDAGEAEITYETEEASDNTDAGYEEASDNMDAGYEEASDNTDAGYEETEEASDGELAP